MADNAANWNQIKIPSGFAQARALRDFMIEQERTANTPKSPEQALNEFATVMTLLAVSHFEVVNAFGELEEGLDAIKKRLDDGGYENGGQD